jgi:hypothetical protein
MISDLTRHRRDFWQYFDLNLPALARRTVRGNETSRWLSVGQRPLIVAHYIAARSVGLFVRGVARERIGHVREYLFAHRTFLAASLDKPNLRLGSTFLVPDICRLDMDDRDNWPAAIEWFAEHSPRYELVFTALQKRREDWPDDAP